MKKYIQFLVKSALFIIGIGCFYVSFYTIKNGVSLGYGIWLLFNAFGGILLMIPMWKTIADFIE